MQTTVCSALRDPLKNARNLATYFVYFSSCKNYAGKTLINIKGRSKLRSPDYLGHSAHIPGYQHSLFWVKALFSGTLSALFFQGIGNFNLSFYI